jgi:signal transduction histidine kinase
LHDRIGQSLTALSLNLNIIGNGGASAPDDAKAQRLRESQTLLQETMTSVRNLISELRPVVLDEYGLLAGLRWYAQEVQRRAGLEILVRGEEPELRLPAKIENALFRIAQEAVNNVLKHAQAKRIDLSLECVGHGVRLGVEDNGKGFETARVGDLARHEHWGLEMMAERAEAVGARFRVESTVGRGTRIMVTLGSAWDR